MTINTKRTIKWLIAIILFVSATLLFIWRLMPFSYTEMKNSVVSVEHRYYYTLDSRDSTLFYFDGISADSLFVNLSEDKHEVIRHSLGCWVNETPLIPSCKGRIATFKEHCDSSVFVEDNFRTYIANEQSRLENNLAGYEHAEKELRYYFDTHARADEGYSKVKRYREELESKIEQTEKMIEKLNEASQLSKLYVNRHDSYYIEYKDVKSSTVRKVCTPTASLYDNMLLQTCDSITPKGVNTVATWHLCPFDIKEINDTVFIIGRTFVNENDSVRRDIEFIPEHLAGSSLTSSPRLNIPEGAPVFTRSGIFIGITSGDTIINRDIIRKSLKGSK